MSPWWQLQLGQQEQQVGQQGLVLVLVLVLQHVVLGLGLGLGLVPNPDFLAIFLVRALPHQVRQETTQYGILAQGVRQAVPQARALRISWSLVQKIL